MAKALAFRRSTREVVLVDTINNSIAPLGPSLSSSDTTAAFPNRSQNTTATTRGVDYQLYRHSSNEIRLARFAAGIWSDVAGFTAVGPTGAGSMVPIGLYVVQDFLVAVFAESADVGASAIKARRSADGVTWDPVVSKTFPTQPLTNEGGHTLVWRNAVFIATNDGIAFYNALTDAFGTTFDVGNDSLLTGPTLVAGCFAFWNNNLYFVKPGTVPTIYRLDAAFDPVSPPASPMWTNQLPTGIPGLGVVTVGPDTGAFLLFVNRLDELCLLYSAQLGTKLIKADSAGFPLFTDDTDPIVPAALRTQTDLGFALFVDDRRRVNELQSILIHYPSASQTQLADWDGTNPINVRTTFAGTILMAPNAPFGALRTYTALQPACHITAESKPFDGRTRLDYVVRDSASRPVDVFGEFSIDGDEWLPMSQGEDDSGAEGLATSPTGIAYFFHWDAHADLDGDFDFVFMRIVARIAGV